MRAKTCYSCGNAFYVKEMAIDFSGSQCSVCLQSEKQRNSERERSYAAEAANAEISRRNAAAAAQQAQAIVAAERATAKAIREQTEILKEISVSPKAAYEAGYNYVQYEFASSNNSNLIITVDENGGGRWDFNNPYSTPTLRDNFKKGLSDCISGYTLDHQNLISSARQAGIMHVRGDLDKTFTLHTGLIISGISINSKIFNSDIEKHIDKKSGEISFSWTPFFNNSELDRAYREGVIEAQNLINDASSKIERIAEIKIKKTQKIISIILGPLLKLFPLFYIYIIFRITDGWMTFFGVISTFFIHKYMKKYIIAWKARNDLN